MTKPDDVAHLGREEHDFREALRKDKRERRRRGKKVPSAPKTLSAQRAAQRYRDRGAEEAAIDPSGLDEETAYGQ